MNHRLVRVLALIVLASPVFVAGEDTAIIEWVKDQLRSKDAESISIIDQKSWVLSPEPNTYIILGIGKKVFDKMTWMPDHKDTFPFVLLVKSSAAGELKDPKQLAISIPEDTFQGVMLKMLAYPNDPLNRPLSIDVAPFQIRKDEYAFGVRYGVAEIGNKSGNAYEVLGLFRYHDSQIREIFRDVVWLYSKYSAGSQSCNIEMVIVPNKPQQGEFYTLTRRLRRAYFGETKGVVAPAVQSCGFTKYERASTHVWDAAKNVYLDSRARLLWWDDLFK